MPSPPSPPPLPPPPPPLPPPPQPGLDQLSSKAPLVPFLDLGETLEAAKLDESSRETVDQQRALAEQQALQGPAKRKEDHPYRGPDWTPYG